MDIFSFMDAMVGPIGVRDTKPGVADLGLPPVVADSLETVLAPLHRHIGGCNLVRDVVLNLAAQQSCYTAAPWVGGIQAGALHLGETDSAALLAMTAMLPRLSCLVLTGSTDNSALIKTYQSLAGDGLKASIRAVNPGVAVIHDDQLLDLGTAMRVIPNAFALVHICGPADVADALRDWRTAFDKAVAGALVIVSGRRDIVEAVHYAVAEQIPEENFRFLYTWWSDGNGSGREEAILVVAVPPAVSRAAHTLGILYDRYFAELKSAASVSDFRQAPLVADLADLSDWSVWSADAANLAMVGGECFALRGYEPPFGPHDMADLLVREDVSLPPARLRRSMGRIGCVPGGGVLDGIALGPDGKALFEGVMAYFLPDFQPRSFWLWEGVPAGRPEESLVGDWMWLPAQKGCFSHWLVESFLPALVMARIGRPVRFLCPDPLPGYQADYFRHAGLDPDDMVIAQPGTRYRCDRLYLPLREDVPRKVFSFARVQHPAAEAGIAALLASAGMTSRQKRNRIYVSRMDARKYRTCLNEEQLISRLKKRGYIILNNGRRLGSMEAVEVYGNAGVIVGAMGAGMCNAIFAPPGAQVVSFQARSYFEEHVEQVSHLIGQDYAYLGCEHFEADDPIEGGCRNGNFVVDLDALDALLDQAESRASAI